MRPFMGAPERRNWYLIPLIGNPYCLVPLTHRCGCIGDVDHFTALGFYEELERLISLDFPVGVAIDVELTAADHFVEMFTCDAIRGTRTRAQIFPCETMIPQGHGLSPLLPWIHLLMGARIHPNHYTLYSIYEDSSWDGLIDGEGQETGAFLMSRAALIWRLMNTLVEPSTLALYYINLDSRISTKNRIAPRFS